MLAAPAAGAGTITGATSDKFVAAGEKQYVTLYLPEDSVLSYTVNITGSSAIMATTGVREASLKYYLADSEGGWMRPTIGSNGRLEGAGGPFPLKAGNYAIELQRSPYANGPETYNWTVNTTVTSAPRSIDTEPNDRATDARSITTGTAVTGHLGYTDVNDGGSGSVDNSDWWKLTLAQTGSVTMKLTADASFTGVTADFMGADQFSKNAITLRPASTGTLMQSATLDGLTAGTYYVQVYRGNVGTGYGGYGSYALELTSPTATVTPPPSATMSAVGPLTAQTLTVQNIQIPASDLAGGVSIYIVALVGNTVATFGPNGWTTQALAYQSGIKAVPVSVTLLTSLDLSALVGTNFYFGYGNGSGDGALNDMLGKQKFAHLHTLSASTASAATNLLDLALWDIYGSAQMQSAALLIGDQLGGDFNDSDKDGNPANVWSKGVVSDTTGFGFDVDWAVSKASFTAPLTVQWNGCLPYSGPDSRFMLGRKNTAFTNKASSPDPITPEIYLQADWTGSTPSLTIGSSTGQPVHGPAVTQTLIPGGAYEYQAVCGDFKLAWVNQVATISYNGTKIGDLPYATGYGEPFGIAFRSFANPIKVNSFSVTQP